MAKFREYLETKSIADLEEMDKSYSSSDYLKRFPQLADVDRYRHKLVKQELTKRAKSKSLKS